MVSAAILNKEKEKRYKASKEKSDLKEEELMKESQLTEEETVNAIFSEAKKRKEAIIEFQKGKRLDLVSKEEAELKILKEYLPEEISEEEIRKTAKEIIDKVKAGGAEDMGKVMKELMPCFRGRAEGNLVSKIVKELLS